MERLYTSKCIYLMSISECTLIIPISIDRNYNLRDPPLTDKGFEQAETLATQLLTIFKIVPSVIVTSPMTRTIQTARTLFPSAFTGGPDAIPLKIWPDLREAHDAICNQGRSRAEMQALHPGLDFSACDEEWNYKPHCFEDSADRAAWSSYSGGGPYGLYWLSRRHESSGIRQLWYVFVSMIILAS